MDRLEAIKEELAKEKGFEDYSELLLQSTHSFGDLDNVITELSNRYAKECVKASLQKASENAESDQEWEMLIVKAESITNENNIVLL